MYRRLGRGKELCLHGFAISHNASFAPIQIDKSDKKSFGAETSEGSKTAFKIEEYDQADLEKRQFHYIKKAYKFCENME